MLDTRCILVDGGPARLRTPLAQRLSVQLAAAGVEHELHYDGGRGHPLRRPWRVADYADASAFVDTLQRQWENFAVRTLGDATAPLALFDAGLFRAPAELLAAGAIDAGAAEDLAQRLLGVLAPLSPVLLYVWHPECDEEDDRAVMDGAFARLEEHRVLLNAARTSASELLDDALSFLGARRRELVLAPELGAALAGRYRLNPGEALELRDAPDGLCIAGLPAPLAGAPRSLLPAIDGTLLVAGADLRLRPALDAEGRPRGLLARTSDPRLDAVPDFLERAAD